MIDHLGGERSMNVNERVSSRGIAAMRFRPVLAVFAAGLVHSLLPVGAFGVHDVVARAGITGASAAVAAWLLVALDKRWVRSSS